MEDFRFRQGNKFLYDYDLTDFWRHEIRVEAHREPEPGQPSPLCLAGDHPCPPEECGGPEGYADRRWEACGFGAMEDVAAVTDLIEAIVVEKNTRLLDDPDTRRELEEAVERLKARDPFLTETFSRRAVNRRLRENEHHRLMHQQLW